MTIATTTPATAPAVIAAVPLGPPPKKEPGWGLQFARALVGGSDAPPAAPPAAQGTVTYAKAALDRAVDAGVVGALGAALGRAHRRGMLDVGAASVDGIGAAVALAISVATAPSHPTASRRAAEGGLTCLAVRAFRFGASDSSKEPPRRATVAETARDLDL